MKQAQGAQNGDSSPVMANSSFITFGRNTVSDNEAGDNKEEDEQGQLIMITNIFN